jgi:hypothetical protein
LLLCCYFFLISRNSSKESGIPKPYNKDGPYFSCYPAQLGHATCRQENPHGRASDTSGRRQSREEGGSSRQENTGGGDSLRGRHKRDADYSSGDKESDYRTAAAQMQQLLAQRSPDNDAKASPVMTADGKGAKRNHRRSKKDRLQSSTWAY